MTGVEAALAAIAELDDAAVLIGVDPESVDRSRRSGPLAGEAIVVKDCVGVPGHATTAGSPVLAEHAVEPGGGVRRLLDAGAVIVATTALHELAFGVTGRNDWRGTPVNPAAPDRLPGGSSSGTAVAVARGIVDVGIGTDTGGSSRIPAACCGIVGFRPSTGRYPGDGLVVLSETRDTLGILARRLADVARYDAVLAGEEEGPAAPSEVERLAIADEAAVSSFDPVVAAAYRRWVDDCRNRGVDTIEIDLAPLLAWDEEASFPIALRETILSFRELAMSIGLTYDELVAGLANDDVRELMATEPPPAAARQDAIDRVLPAMRSWYEAVLADATVLAVPTMPVPPPLRPEHDQIDTPDGPVPTFPTMARLTSPASLAGVPSLSVPLAHELLPVSVMLEGRRGRDRELLGAGLTLFDGGTVG
ncbi:MAG: amidase family protein [Actinomycetota bacterium]